MPFDAANFRPGEWQSYASEWLPAASQQGRRTRILFSNFPSCAGIAPLEQLLRFWAHPVRAFSSMRLRVNFRPEESDIPDASLSLLRDCRYQLNQELLNTLVEQQDVEKLFRRTIAPQEHCPMARLARLSGKPSAGDAGAGRAGYRQRQPGQSMEIDLACAACI
jgi:exodeoxyribonuclease V gamma subunit